LIALSDPARVSGQIAYASPTRATPDDVVIGIIHDPERTMRLVSVRGRVHSANFASVATALDEVGEGGVVHLDLTDAEFAGAAICAQLGRVLDRLEDRHVKVRIVGLHAIPLDPVD
jgi:hypothetical protein